VQRDHGDEVSMGYAAAGKQRRQRRLEKPQSEKCELESLPGRGRWIQKADRVEKGWGGAFRSICVQERLSGPPRFKPAPGGADQKKKKEKEKTNRRGRMKKKGAISVGVP